MSDTVIRVENLGKKYIISHQQQERYTALRDVVTNKAKSLGNLINPKTKVENYAFEEFWALKDVSFEIKQGDKVGIIGRNGAGKSTLLKILSRIAEPTTGSIRIKGRVASLLEVGTGFHPELTGRENIFLNGAILGMSKAEIQKKFDEIVEFAEVEKFLDTPVKRYSSGMYVRLAFAVAAHLEPEILIVDEVLAVGDAAFQKKCLGKMEDVGKEGRTVLFVSHNMPAVSNLCSQGIVLVEGKNQLYSSIDKAVMFYTNNTLNKLTLIPLESRTDRKGNGKARFISFSLCNDQQQIINRGVSGQKLIFKIQIDSKSEVRNEMMIALGIKDRQGQYLFHCSTIAIAWEPSIVIGTNVIYCSIPKLPLTPGIYWVDVYCEIRREVADWIVDAFSFEVDEGDFFGTGKISPPSKKSSIYINHNWSLEQ
ncbi:ABC transporter ATP-binding protein [Calothrix sp. NIES-2100]|uniref:ABC transporter ATP-binding protein n=1 Tax=Calothrix sp. NIES-2100 TaxID=1954172 RepID=UPI000B5E3546|nr:ABC transporter ATP-binding protein [Calothrix sp. NIES-2100]